MAREFVVEVITDVLITVDDDDVIGRVVSNVDGWQETFYDMKTETDVAEHLAYNYGRNGHVFWQLDGWADYAPDSQAVKYRLLDTEVNVLDRYDIDSGDASKREAYLAK
jgi:hypothetical protein